jgi:drug/metabolite transporter (DMT)-like permease
MSYLFTKIQLQDMGAFQAAAARVLISAALVAPAIVRLPRSGIGLWAGIALGVLGIVAYYAGFNVGLETARATDAGVIQATIPAVTAVLAIAVLGERPRWQVWAGIALSFAGVVALVTGTSAGGEGSLIGDLWIVFSVAVWSLYSVFARRLGTRASATAITAATLGWGAVLLVPFAAFELQAVTPRLTLAGGAATLYLAVFAGAIGYWLWSYGLSRVPAAQATTYLNLLPVVAATSGALVLGERIGVTELLAGAVIVAGVFLATRDNFVHARRRPPA